MIKTVYDPSDAAGILELGRQFHQESHFRGTSYDEPKCRMLMAASLMYPEKIFIAYDDTFQGIIVLQMSTQFFNDQKWAGDQAFYVTPQARGSGLAKQLLDAGSQWAKQNGASDLVIFHNAGIGIEKAEGFYNPLGFNLSGLIFNKSLVDN